MPRQSLPIEQILSMLAAAPPRIAALAAGLEPARLRTRPAADEWSANDVLAHLRACADMWGACIAAMLAEDRPTIKAMNPTTWIMKTDYPGQEFQASLEAFAVQRTGLLAVLQGLDPAGWARSATITGAGKPLERTVRTYAEWLAVHERPHLKQIERLLKPRPA